MEATKVGVLVTVLIFVVGLGIYVLEGQYSGALTKSGSNFCEETETLFPKPEGDLEAKQSIFLKGGTKTKVGIAPWSSITQESCSENTLAERYCTSTATAASETLTCDNGCNDGKCNPPTCVDSDGIGYTTAGTTTGLNVYDPDTLGVPPATQSAKTYSDTCTSNTMLKEYKCSSINNNLVVFEQKNCATLGSGYTCSNGACVAPAPVCSSGTEKCDGCDNDNDGQMDEGCDDDNDDYCDKTITRATSYSCSGSDNCCLLGGGDCYDYNNEVGVSINPGAQEDCFKGYDENCNYQYEESCAPYTCNDDDPEQDITVGGTVTLMATGSGQSKTIIDSCKNENLLNQSSCGVLQANYLSALSVIYVDTGCSCVGSDSPSGTTPAVCS